MEETYQSTCESQLIQVSVVFIFKFEFYFSYFSGRIKFLMRV